MRGHGASTLREVGFIVCTALDREGVTAILTGGSAATVYAPEAHQSRDLDFVLEFRVPDPRPGRVLAGLGYREERGVYAHPENPLTHGLPARSAGGGWGPAHLLEHAPRGAVAPPYPDPHRPLSGPPRGVPLRERPGEPGSGRGRRAGPGGKVGFKAVRSWCAREGAEAGYDELRRATER